MNHVIAVSALRRRACLLALLFTTSGCDALSGRGELRVEDSLASVMTATGAEEETYVTSPSTVIPGFKANAEPRPRRDVCRPGSSRVGDHQRSCVATAPRVGDDANLSPYAAR